MQRFPIMEMSQVAEARRFTIHLAHTLSFNETDTGRLALVVTEAASNLVKHATNGQLLVRPLADVCGIEILALDTGPGIRHVHQCLRDGYSTAGSLGTGLGAITRLATRWDMHSVAGVGTALLMQVMPAASSPSLPPSPWLSHAPPSSPGQGGDKPSPARLEVGGISVPKSGEDVCGDAWMAVHHAGRYLVIVVDGLGHGLMAAEAAQAAIRMGREHPADPPVALIERMHGSLRSTRGAAVAIAEVNLRRQDVTFTGVGNIAGSMVMTDKTQHLMSHNGIVGHQIRKLHTLTYPWSDNALLVLHSDGLATRWNLQAYPGLAERHPSLIAGVLYRDFARGRDDVTVVVARIVPRNQ
jgi:anti-sigma regulatory factor (Ser/Thr protein kinase)